MRVSVYDALVDFDWRDVHGHDGVYHIGASWTEIADRILRFDPDIVGITNPFSDVADYTIRVAREVKRARMGVTTVVGGPHATSCPEAFLAEGSPVDFVVRGEGEITLLNLVQALSVRGSPKDVPGVSFREGDRVLSNAKAPFVGDLDLLPLPAYHMVPMERYFELVEYGYPSRYTFEYPGSEREVSIVTSRGCPFHCIFCGNHIHMGRRWRSNSVEYVLRHMELLVARYGVRHFHLEDDNVALDVQRFSDLLTGIQRKRWGITWDTPNGIRLDGLTPDLLARIKDSHCTYLEFGIDSGRQETLDHIIKKGVELVDVEQVLKTCSNLQLDVHTLFVVGFPGEDKPCIDETFRFAKRMFWKYEAVPHLCMARPLPGTELHAICEKNGYLSQPVLPEIGSGLRGEIYPRVMIKTDEFAPDDLEKWIRKFNRQIIAMIIIKTSAWLLRHPSVFREIWQRFRRDRRRGLQDAIKRIFFGGLFFKFNWLDGARTGRVAECEKSRVGEIS